MSHYSTRAIAASFDSGCDLGYPLQLSLMTISLDRCLPMRQIVVACNDLPLALRPAGIMELSWSGTIGFLSFRPELARHGYLRSP